MNAMPVQDCPLVSVLDIEIRFLCEVVALKVWIICAGESDEIPADLSVSQCLHFATIERERCVIYRFFVRVECGHVAFRLLLGIVTGYLRTIILLVYTKLRA